MSLSQIIKIDQTKCINCHKCIAVCPVKYCNDGSGETIKLNHDLCIGCGQCIEACKHDARLVIDDFDKFMSDLSKGEKIVAFVAPSSAIEFADEYLEFNGYLKSIGVKAIFDVSFGGELTVTSYLEYIKKANPQLVISQPCPAIVTYIELYQPELLKYLAPADSPVLHAMKMVKHFYQEYRDCKFAFISPCIAKKREFDETGIGDYNVTYQSIKKHFEKQNINLLTFPKTPYNNPDAERGVVFSSPGGLLETAHRENDAVYSFSRKIEGTDIIYKYFQGLPEIIEKKITPLLVDCLNCEKGCNGGTGTTTRELPVDYLEHKVQERKNKLCAKYNSKTKMGKAKVQRIIRSYWKDGLYNRKYVDLSKSVDIKMPNDRELNEIFHKMDKFEKSDLFDCGACGYNNCKQMAIAIYNGLNKTENCVHFTKNLAHQEAKTSKQKSELLINEVNQINQLILDISHGYEELLANINHLSDNVTSETTTIESVINDLANAVSQADNNNHNTSGMETKISDGNKAISTLVTLMNDICNATTQITESIGYINEISDKTNLLSMNASIEASHADKFGKGFAVVATEIRKLSAQTREYSRNISALLNVVTSKVDDASANTHNTQNLIKEIFNNIKSFSESTRQVVEQLQNINRQNSNVKMTTNELSEITMQIKNQANGLFNVITNIKSSVDRISSIK